MNDEREGRSHPKSEEEAKDDQLEQDAEGQSFKEDAKDEDDKDAKGEANRFRGA